MKSSNDRIGASHSARLMIAAQLTPQPDGVFRKGELIFTMANFLAFRDMCSSTQQDAAGAISGGVSA